VLTDLGKYLLAQYELGNPTLRAHLDAEAMRLLISKLVTDVATAKKATAESTKAQSAMLGHKKASTAAQCNNCEKDTLNTYTFGGKNKFRYCHRKDCKEVRDAHFLRLNPGGAAAAPAPVHYVAAPAPAPAKSSGNPLLTQSVEQLQALYEKSSNIAIKAAINAELSRRRPNTPVRSFNPRSGEHVLTALQVHRESPPASPTRGLADMSSDELLIKSLEATNETVKKALEAAYEKALARENAATTPLSIDQQMKVIEELSAAASSAESEADVDEEYVVPRGGGGKSKRRAVADDE